MNPGTIESQGGPGRTVLRYALFAGLWILLSDLAGRQWSAGVGSLAFNVAKGLVFVAVTSGLLWFLLRRREDQLAAFASALASEEERYRALFENSSLPMLLATPRGRILKANAAAGAMLAPDGDDLRGRRLTSYVTSDLDAFRASLQAVREGDATRFEACLASPKEGIIEAVVSGAPIWLSGKSHLLLSIVDETARRRDQRAVDVNRAYLKAIIEADPDGIVATNTEGRWITWNRRLRDMWHVSDEFVRQATTAPVTDLHAVPGISLVREPSALFESIAQTVENPDHVVRELVETTDGKWFEIESHPVYGSALDYLGRAWFVRDVTERRRLERELKETVARYRAMFDAAPLAIITIDTKGVVTAWSKGAERTFGWLQDEALGRIPPFVTGEFEDQFRANFGQVLAGAEMRGLRVTWRHKSGALLALRLHTVPLADAEGRCSGCLAVMEDVTEREDTARRLADAVSIDPVTNLVNRRSFMAALKLLQIEAARTEESLALLYLDIDNFKGVNEAFGPKVGDRLLREFGEFLLRSCRPDDLVARLGGDEFAILRRRVEDPAAVSEFLNDVLQEATASRYLGELAHNLSASAGYALFPLDASNPEEFLRAAEAANHEAKKRGRSTARAFDARLTSEARRRHEVEAGLHKAIEDRAFELHYQPQVCLVSGRILGYEGLIRWRHPQRGLLPPGEFIDIAESSGLIVPIGKWVLREVGRMCALSNASGGSPLRFSANLSSAQFADPAIVDLVSEIIRENRIERGALEIELTESMLAADPERAVIILRALSGLGVCLAIDDFGTGYSSLQYLKRFQADRLKIDRSFVKDLPRDETSGAIARSIVALGRSLGMRIIAEGVETEQQAGFLAAIGVDEGQGWHFGKPRPADDCGFGAAGALTTVTT